MQTKLLIFIFLLSAGAMPAQQVVTTAGDFNSNTSGSLSWTLGECVIATYTGTNVVLNQGFQQSKLTVTAIKEFSENSLAISIYPNPTNDFVLIKGTPESVKSLRYMLFDLNGKLLAEQKVTDSETKISFNNLLTGTYLLRLIRNDQEVQVFKIVKQ
jgi:hypothetical protein